MIWYCACAGTVREVEVVRETPKQVVLVSGHNIIDGKGYERVALKSSAGVVYTPDRKQAVRIAYNELRDNKRRLEEQYKRAEAALSTFMQKEGL